MIPKIIHFVWVGNQPKPQTVLNCMESWKKYCPDYEFVEWGNEDVEKINNTYVREAYENKKWAFVSDYLRLFALYKYGGFYFDTDLELTADIDKFRRYDFVMGYEKYKSSYSPLTAFMGAKEKNNIINDLLSEYNHITFVKKGKMDLTTNVQRFAAYLEKKYMLKSPFDGNEVTKPEEGFIIFPYWFFCSAVEGKENYSIHHYDGTWIDGWSRKNIIKIYNYRIVRFRKRKNILNDNLPILKTEKITKAMDVKIFGLILKLCIVKG